MDQAHHVQVCDPCCCDARRRVGDATCAPAAWHCCCSLLRGCTSPWCYSAGLGQIDHGHLYKNDPELGMLVVKIGGPAYRIGMGGGAASSVPSGGNRAELDFNAVQVGERAPGLQPAPAVARRPRAPARAGCSPLARGSPRSAARLLPPLPLPAARRCGGGAEAVARGARVRGAWRKEPDRADPRPGAPLVMHASRRVHAAPLLLLLVVVVGQRPLPCLPRCVAREIGRGRQLQRGQGDYLPAGRQD